MRLTKSLESKVRLVRTSEVKKKKEKSKGEAISSDLESKTMKTSNLMTTKSVKSPIIGEILPKVNIEEPATMSTAVTREAIMTSTKEIMATNEGNSKGNKEGNIKGNTKGNNEGNKEGNNEDNMKGNTLSTPEKLHYRLHSSLQSQHLLRQQMWQLQQDNLALRELCCFLQEDRLKARKNAEEWRKFGEHSSNVMRSELKHYQNKLQLLEAKQEMLLEENFRLKEKQIDDNSKCNDNKKKSIKSGFECPSCGDNIIAVEANTIMMNTIESGDNSADSCYWTENGSSVLEGVSCGDAESNAKAKLVMDVFQLADNQLDHEHVAAEKAILVEMCNVVWRSLEN